MNQSVFSTSTDIGLMGRSLVAAVSGARLSDWGRGGHHRSALFRRRSPKDRKWSWGAGTVVLSTEGPGFRAGSRL
jgi:hypothetical protein